MKMIMELVDVIGDDVTSDDIIKALRAYQKKRDIDRAAARRNYISTGRPAGRPRKEPIIFTGDIDL